MNKKAVVLLSGGLDSAVALYLAKHEGYQTHAISFDYGQKHQKELHFAKQTAQKLGIEAHKIVKLNLADFGGSSLTDSKIQIQEGNINNNEIPITYVPARNMVFLSIAASYAETIQSQNIFIGVSQVDYSGYVDCRQEFIQAMEHAINMGTVMSAEHNKKITIHTPFINKSKKHEIELGVELGVDFSLTWSCYKGGETPCKKCDSCLLRAQAFKQAGIIDTLITQ